MSAPDLAAGTERGAGIVGIDIGGTKALGVLLGADGWVIAEHRVPTPCGAEALGAAVDEVLDGLGVRRPQAVGVGVAGLVTRAGVLRMGPNLPGTLEWDVAGDLHRRFGAGVRLAVLNDATAAALAEWRGGAAVGADDAAVVTLGTGIGAGFVTGGRLLLGCNGFAGEPGHAVVVAGGEPCVCGQRGCWERYASGSALARFGTEAGLAAPGGRALRGEDVVAAAAAGDGRARAALGELARWVALGVVNLVNVLDPEVVVLGGGLVGAAEWFLPAVAAELPGLLYGSAHRPLPSLRAALLGERAGAIGAALAAAGDPAVRP